MRARKLVPISIKRQTLQTLYELREIHSQVNETYFQLNETLSQLYQLEL